MGTCESFMRVTRHVSDNALQVLRLEQRNAYLSDAVKLIR